MTAATLALPSPPSPFDGSDWFDPLEEAVRGQVRAFIEQLLEEELAAALGRGRYERGEVSNGRRHGHRPRQLVTTFGPLTLSVPRARLHDEAGEQEWKSELVQQRRNAIHAYKDRPIGDDHEFQAAVFSYLMMLREVNARLPYPDAIYVPQEI